MRLRVVEAIDNRKLKTLLECKTCHIAVGYCSGGVNGSGAQHQQRPGGAAACQCPRVFSSSFLLTAPRHSKIPELILPQYLCKTTGLFPLSFQLSNLTTTASFFPFKPFYFTALPFLLSFLLTITNNASIGTPLVYLKPLRSSRRIKASGISDPLSCVCSSLCPLVCRISLFVRKRFGCDLAMMR